MITIYRHSIVVERPREALARHIMLVSTLAVLENKKPPMAINGNIKISYELTLRGLTPCMIRRRPQNGLRLFFIRWGPRQVRKEVI